MTYLNARFVEPGSKEFRDLLYERLRQLIVGLREGLYTQSDLFYIVTSLVALGDLTKEQALQILKSPTLATLDNIFGKRTVRKVATRLFGDVELPDETPCLVVVPNREVATLYLRKFSFLVPVEKFEPSIEYAVCSIYKAVSIVTTHGDKVRSIVLLPDDHRLALSLLSGNVASRIGQGYVTLIILAKLWNITVTAPFVAQFDFEHEEVRRNIENLRVRALLAVLDELETTTGERRVVTFRTPICLDPYLPAICVAFCRKYGLEDYVKLRKIVFDTYTIADYDRQFYEYLSKILGHLPNEVVLAGWWRFGMAGTEVDNDRYELAKKLGFDERTARKISQWRVESINDIVRLLKDLKYNYRDEEYFRNSVVPRIAQIFNTRPEVLLQLLELDLL